jgi:hypothetical protein
MPPLPQVGRQAWVGNHNISLVTPDMVTIGATVSMGSDSHFYNATPTASGHITFCDGCDVGHQTTLFPGAVMQPGSVLGAKSNVMEGETLPAGAIRLVGCGCLAWLPMCTHASFLDCAEMKTACFCMRICLAQAVHYCNIIFIGYGIAAAAGQGQRGRTLPTNNCADQDHTSFGCRIVLTQLALPLHHCTAG